MHNYLIIGVSIALLAAPSFVVADSYEPPNCAVPSGSLSDSDSNRANTPFGVPCKQVTVTSVVTLDSQLQANYVLATHKPLEGGCDREGCSSVTQNSEFIYPVEGNEITVNHAILESPSTVNGDGSTYEGIGLWYHDEFVLLDRTYVLDFIQNAYKQKSSMSSIYQSSQFLMRMNLDNSFLD